jgi:serine-type D-Ala-D-Ala carboxypeptidase (penicillin-binding protein 5/6)
VLYNKNADAQRPVASLSKLVSALAIRSLLPVDTVVEIPEEVLEIQPRGADIRLPVGEHASVRALLAASMIPSANDAMLTLAIAASGSEDDFVEHINEYLEELGLSNTYLANSTGLYGGEQYSTARDVSIMLQQAYSDAVLRPMLFQGEGTLITREGTQRSYRTTNQLLGTYLPILAAKTGFTEEAGQNLAIMTHNGRGNRIGVVVLGSEDRFQDTKVLVEWIWRNYTWPS